MQAHIDTMTSIFDGNIVVEDGRVTVKNERALSGPQMDTLVREAVFGDEATRDYARWLIWEIGQAVGTRPSSIHDLYLARGRGEVRGFTVPAINVRAMTYDTARSIFRVAKKMDAGAFIFEIARSEIAYTEQRPTEYVAVILGAALREGFRGPVFIQGDHFQVNHKKYANDPKTEVDSVKQLVTEAVAAGFYNIDIDTSTLVDISKKTLDEQQRLNYEVGIDILQHVRAQQPEGVVISVGGEIGEVGTANSTVEELRAYMDGFERTRKKAAPDAEGLSKISVQSGTSHGGVVLADGSIADVAIDFKTLETLSKVARDDYGLAGAVQHGASTLPDTAFNNFPRLEVAEIHLATNFQNMMYDNIPGELRDEIYEWLRTNAKDERKATDTDEQFFYKSRKKAIGPFKRRLWDLPAEVKTKLSKAYDAKFEFLFSQLAVGGTAKAVKQHVRVQEIHRPMPHEAEAVLAAPDDADLSD
ncbi:MAG: aldolase [Gemmatimonadaceae bacterium]|nr:aldolase [Gemmatimonadaceae bacterium]NUR20658.1 aldolase [Gemmatimonadaceae bacterium]NUS98005.1 aldolase [Gemmatimonadaceae bacterium]